MCLLVAVLSQAAVTRVTGVTMDHSTGEPLPFVQIMFDGSAIGTTSDMDGNFVISNERGLVSLSFRSVGYKTKIMTVKPGKSQELFVVLEPEVYALSDVVVNPDTPRFCNGRATAAGCTDIFMAYINDDFAFISCFLVDSVKTD